MKAFLKHFPERACAKLSGRYKRYAKDFASRLWHLMALTYIHFALLLEGLWNPASGGKTVYEILCTPSLRTFRHEILSGSD